MTLYNALIWLKGRSADILGFSYALMALVSVAYLCMAIYDTVEHTNRFSNGFVLRIYFSIYATFTLIVSIVTFLDASIRIRFGANDSDPDYLEIDCCCRKYTMFPDGNIKRVVKEEAAELPRELQIIGEEAARNAQSELEEIRID